MARLLFTGGGGAGNEAIWRTLEGPHTLYFADADRSAIDPSIPEERRLQIPFAGDAAFAASVIGMCRELGIDMLVPGVDEELPHLAPLRDGNPAIMVPQADFVAMTLDKFVFANALSKAGLNVPDTRLLQDFDGMPYPFIAKPRTGRGSRSVFRVERPGQVAAYLEMGGQDAAHYIAQALAKGTEYTVCVHADESGELRTIIPVRVDIKRGITISATAERCEPIFNYVVEFQNIFRPKGIYNLQCILDGSGKVWPFEINPRVSTTFCLALRCGFDPFRDDSRNAEKPLHLPEKSVSLRRFWTNAIT